MRNKIQKNMVELNMVSPGDKVLVGVSGGADSVCLLLALDVLKKEMDFSLEVIHVEHGIRGEESRKDAEFVEDLCKRMQIVCHKESVDVPAYCKETGLGTEEAARILRYQVFAKLALEKRAKVALAHHMEDNAETILFQMARGSSLAGLCGMQPVREDENGVCYIRPLLCLHRQEIERFLQSHGMGYRVDSTNQELDYSRNYIRNVVLPDLMKVNEQVVAHMNMTAAHLSEVKEYMDQEASCIWEKIATVETDITLDVKALFGLHKAMQKEIAYRAISESVGGKKDITSTHVSDLLALCHNQSGKELTLPNGVVARKEYETIRLFSAPKKDSAKRDACVYEVSEKMLEECLKSAQKVELQIGDKGETLCYRVFEMPEETLEIPRKTYTKWLDYDKIKQGFCIRTRRSGDYFISDAKGHRKKLKTYFIDEKVPLAERENKWLLTQDSEVLWMIDGRISEHIKVSQKTKYIIEITYDGGN